MRNTMRWLANRLSKRQLKVKYTEREGDYWQRWPQHIRAPIKADLKKINAEGFPAQPIQRLGGGLRIHMAKTFVLFYDGDTAIRVHAVMLPDGAIWDWTLLREGKNPWR